MDHGYAISSTGEVSGHLIAGGTGSGSAYIVPMDRILEDLSYRFPSEWELMGWVIEGRQRQRSPQKASASLTNQDTKGQGMNSLGDLQDLGAISLL